MANGYTISHAAEACLASRRSSLIKHSTTPRCDTSWEIMLSLLLPLLPRAVRPLTNMATCTSVTRTEWRFPELLQMALLRQSCKTIASRGLTPCGLIQKARCGCRRRSSTEAFHSTMERARSRHQRMCIQWLWVLVRQRLITSR